MTGMALWRWCWRWAAFFAKGALAEAWQAAFMYNFHFSATVSLKPGDRLRNAVDLSYIALMPIFSIAILGVLASVLLSAQKQDRAALLSAPAAVGRNAGVINL